MALREILAKFGVAFDDKQLKAGNSAIDSTAKSLATLGKAFVAGAAVKAISDSVMALSHQADALAKQSQVLGISTADLQTWQFAADLSGVSAEEFTGALTKFNKGVSDAASGTGPAAEALKKLGLSAKDSSGNLRQPSELLDGIAGGLENIKNPADRAKTVMALFGKSGARLLPLFSQGAEGIAKMRAEVEELGGGISPEFAAQAEATNDSITRLNFAFLSMKSRLGALILPLIERFTVFATKAVASVTKWVDQTDIFGKSANVAAAAAAVLGTAFAIAGAKALIPWLPTIALFAGLILLVDEFITLWKGGDTIISRAIDKIFGEGSTKKAVGFVKEVVKSTKELFTDTFRAFAEFDAGLKLLWFDLTSALSDTWSKAMAGIVLAAFDMIAKVAKVVQKIPGAENVLSDFNAAGREAILASATPDAAGREAQRQAIIRSSEVGARGPVDASVTVNVTVPPGTPAQQAQAIGAAARRGAMGGNRAKLAALDKKAGD